MYTVSLLWCSFMKIEKLFRNSTQFPPRSLIFAKKYDNMKNREELSILIEDFISKLPFPAQPRGLYEPIEYTLEGGGKRLRPLILLMTQSIFNPTMEHELNAAAAVEVFHNFTLLHDDIMDNAKIRRGKDTVHVKWGNSTSILSGDAMVIYAYSLLSRVDTLYLPRVLEIFNKMAIEVCEGQQYDMDFESTQTVSLEEYLEMIRLKTSVLIAGSAQIGAVLGGATVQEGDIIYRYALELGLAFQIQDDYLDTFGSRELLGKSIGGDILEGKKTFLSIIASIEADSVVREELMSLLHSDSLAPDTKIARVKEIYNTLKVADIAKTRIEKHLNVALEILSELDLSVEKIEPLKQLVYSLLDRNN